MDERKPTQATHILVAEDDATVRSFFSQLLSRQGYRVTEVSDGAQALERLRAGDIDAVLSDIGMPGLNGIQLLHAVGASESSPPVVLVTGDPNLRTAADAVAGRAVDYLCKPVKPEQLLQAIGRAVRISHLAKNRRALTQLLADRDGRGASDDTKITVQKAFDSIWLAFQPVVDLSSSELYAYEAQPHSEGSTAHTPAELLREAAAAGRSYEWSRKIRELLAASMQSIPADVLVFIHLLPVDLLDENLYATSAPLTAHASRVILEITERDSLEMVVGLAERLKELRRLGYRIAVDGLGAGHSGLNSLLALQPEVVKLDTAMVRNIHINDSQRRLVASVVTALRSTFEAKIIAEGVEKIEERDVLRKMGVNVMLGDFFGKPSKTANYKPA